MSIPLFSSAQVAVCCNVQGLGMRVSHLQVWTQISLSCSFYVSHVSFNSSGVQSVQSEENERSVLLSESNQQRSVVMLSLSTVPECFTSCRLHTENKQLCVTNE